MQAWRPAPQKIGDVGGGEVLARGCYVAGLEFLEAAQTIGFGSLLQFLWAEDAAQALGGGQFG